jgi:hypothetical protein
MKRWQPNQQYQLALQTQKGLSLPLENYFSLSRIVAWTNRAAIWFTSK